MQKLVKEYLNELNRRQRKRRKANIAVMLLVVIVFSGVVGVLTQYGVAMTEEAKCGMEEHQHVEECYQDVLICGREESEGHQHGEECYQTENVLVCGQEEHEGHAHVEECYQEDGTLVCGMEESEGHQHGEACYESRSNLVCGQEESEAHVHVDGCYERQLVCGKEEHTHTEVCRIDLSADVEDASKWDAQYADVSWSGNWGEDLATAAQKQLGYKESMNNYQIAENGSHKGYTRYGQFMGDVYADWDAAFVNFCLHYARLANTGMFTNEKDSGSWHGRIANGANAGYLTTADGYEPKVGDIVFFHRSGEETSTQMGIVSSYDNGSNEIKVIEGNSGNEVRENRYAANDGHIFAYLKVTEMERAYKHIGEDAVGTEGTEPGEDANENENPGTEGADGVNPEVEDVDGEDSTNSGVEDMDGEENADSSDEDGENVELGTENKEAGTENGDLEAEGGNDVNAEEEIPAAVVEELEKSPAYEASYEDDMGTIHVAAGEGTIPEGAELSVKKIEPVMTTADLNDEEVADAREINDQYELTAKKLLEKSEKNNTTLEGFLAYDISFLVDGVEVEPNGPVKVTMDFNEAVKPEGVSENATVAVNHLKEDATAEDGVVVEDLTEKAATTITTKEEEVAVEKVELVTGSFSTFVISWTLNGMRLPPLDVICVNQNGEEIDNGILGFPDSMSIEMTQGVKKELWTLLGLEEIGNLYKPIEIQVGQQSDESGWSGVKVCDILLSYDSELVFCDDNDMEARRIPLWELSAYSLRIVYEVQLTDVVPMVGVHIENRVREEGNLKAILDIAELNDELKARYDQAVADGESIHYVWSKSVNGGEFTPSVREQYDNGQYNVAESGEWINVALDGGALNKNRTDVKYQVELLIGDTPLVKSETFSVQYYEYVRNGSFENPQYTGKTNQVSDATGEKDGTSVEAWYSTAMAQVEIARVVNGYINDDYGYKGLFAAADGEQFAELNCEAEGALYQDVLVIKGTPLYYSFAHRGRVTSGSGGNDKMFLVIIPTYLAEAGIKKEACTCGKTHSGAIDTQDEVKCLRTAIQNGNGERYYPGAIVEDFVANTKEWQRHTGEYIPECNLNRFFFVSNEDIRPKEGNFLDDISFSQYLPKPEEGRINFRIEKVIRGLEGGTTDEEKAEFLKQIGDLQFDINIDGKPSTIEEIKTPLLASDMTWSYNVATGSWVGVMEYNNIVMNKDSCAISVTEKNETVNSYTCVTKVTELINATTVSSDEELNVDADGTQGDGTTGTQGNVSKTGEVQVLKNTSKGLRFLNTYSSEEVTYDWKVVKHSSTGEDVYVPGVEFTLTDTSGEKISGTSGENGIVNWPESIANLNGTYTLSEIRTVDGYVLTTENLVLAFKDGKLQSIPNTDGKSYIRVTVTQNECTILVKNDVEFYELPSTGGAGIYLYMFGGVLLMAAAALITYRNKRREVLRS